MQEEITTPALGADRARVCSPHACFRQASGAIIAVFHPGLANLAVDPSQLFVGAGSS